MEVKGRELSLNCFQHLSGTVRNSTIMSIDPEKRKELKVNKSTLWYQQKKIKEGKTINIYNKTKVRIE